LVGLAKISNKKKKREMPWIFSLPFFSFWDGKGRKKRMMDDWGREIAFSSFVSVG